MYRSSIGDRGRGLADDGHMKRASGLIPGPLINAEKEPAGDGRFLIELTADQERTVSLAGADPAKDRPPAGVIEGEIANHVLKAARQSLGPIDLPGVGVSERAGSVEVHRIARLEVDGSVE